MGVERRLRAWCRQRFGPASSGRWLVWVTAGPLAVIARPIGGVVVLFKYSWYPRRVERTVVLPVWVVRELGPSRWAERMTDMLKKTDVKSGKNDKLACKHDKAFASDHPTLWDYLTQLVWEDGTVRRTATLTIFAEDGLLKVCINDRDSARSLWASDETWAGTFEALEALLGDPKAPWRCTNANGIHSGNPAKRK